MAQAAHKEERLFLANQWYAAAWSEEVIADTPLARTIASEPLVMWRTPEGGIHALAERCPHRFAPLSMGKFEGDRAQCPYHGLAFDGRTGVCVSNPHGPITSSLAIRAYPIIERHKMLWAWLGEPEMASPDLIPDLSFIDEAAEHALGKGYMHTAADHRLLEDNIMDLSHADYLHPHTLGGGSITRTRAEVEERGNIVLARWLVSGEPALPIFRPEMPSPDMKTDMWTEVLWYPSGVMILRAGATPMGHLQTEGVNTWNAHIMTPETVRSTHYFYANSRNFKTEDAEYNALFANALRAAFETEDKPIIEAQQRMIGDADILDLGPALLGVDNGSTRARRIYSRLLAEERALPAHSNSI